jgi:hypothetical protein
MALGSLQIICVARHPHSIARGILVSSKFFVGQTVYVPSILLPNGERYPTCLYRTTIAATQDRSARVALTGGVNSEWIATSKIHDNAGIVIITIGDFSTEETLLNPLSKSVLQFSRLLLDDSSVTSLRVRSVGELGAWWALNHDAYSHVVLIGHGSPNSIHFGHGGACSAAEFQQHALNCGGGKTFISLSCETGKAAFAKPFSLHPACNSLIAPYHSVHGAVASQFFETFMCCQLLYGKSITVAFKKAAETVPGTDIFRLWKDGKHAA